MTPSDTPFIALVDDDRNILVSVRMALEAEGFDVQTYSDGAAALKDFAALMPSLIVLDIKMPRMNGFEILEELRKTSHTPVIFLTSKDEETDEVDGLRLGADDYITKPFSQRLLIERIRALLRRAALKTQPAPASQDEAAAVHICGFLKLDDARHICTWKDRPVSLSVTEYLLLKALSAKPGHIRARQQLIDAAYGETIYIDDRTVDSHIKRLRKKLKALDPDFNQIETLYGAGYRYKAD